MLPPLLYKDEALLVFDKPSGLLVVPDRFDGSRPHLMGMVQSRFSDACVNVHRLDGPTSGVVVFARNADIVRKLGVQFETGQVTKRYLALVTHSPATTEGLIEAPLAADPWCPGRMRVHARGKASRTDYQVRERWRSGHALLDLAPRTGRTHQIRVHLAHLGFPVLADSLYGSERGLYLSDLKPRYRAKAGITERPLLGRLALHAQRLVLHHPISDSSVEITAPLPKDFTVALKYLRRFQSL